MNFLSKISLILCLLCPLISKAQEKSYAEQFEQLMAEMDSLSIFNLLDSTLNAATSRYSELNIRAAYSSNVAVAGRNYGINQHGFAPGVTYYHKSGLFGDVTGYWNSAYDPAYNLTMLSAGYFGTVGNFSYIPSYERWIYTDDSSASLFNSLGLSLSQNIKFLRASVDYSFLFGSETAHRLILSGSGYVSFKDVWFFDAISLMPSIGVLYGNDEVTTIRFSDENAVKLTIESLYPITKLPEADQRLFLRNLLLNTDFRRSRILILYQNLENYGTILSPETIARYEANVLTNKTNNVFGLMNWNFSIPIFFTIDQFNISLSYSYNIPQSLPGEVISFDPISYLGASVTYRVPFKK